MDDYIESVKKMEETQIIVKAMIQDFMHASNALDEYVDMLKNPITMIMCDNLKEEMDSRINKAKLFFMMASNKIDILNQLMDSYSEKGADE